MTIDDLKNVKLSEATQGYLAIYLKLCDLYGNLSDVTSIEYRYSDEDAINRKCNEAISNTQDEVMKLVNKSTIENVSALDNSTKI